MCVESQQLLDINLAAKLLCYLLIHQGSQQKDVSTAADDVRTSAGAKSQNQFLIKVQCTCCLLYTSDAADE